MSKLTATYKHIPKSKHTRVPYYKLESLMPCCFRLEAAVADRAIAFGEKDVCFNRSTTLNIYLCHPYPEGAVWDEFPINFCPFCGAVVEVKEVK